jgi:hypothetical protein
MEREGGNDDASRIAYGFKICTSRSPNPKECAVLQKTFQSQREHPSTDENANPMIVIARVLLNLDETVTKE